MTPLPVGEPVPDFTLRREDGQEFCRPDILGQISVLVFYPFAFSPVCTDQLKVYDEVLDRFEAMQATPYGVSCDSNWTQTAFRERLGVRIAQLSDWEPKGDVCRALGVYHDGGFPQRALVIVDPEGVVRWSYQASSPGELPPPDLIFDALAN